MLYDGVPHAAIATTSPAGLAVDLTYNGSPAPPTAPGSYAVAATINDANYFGSATGTMVISTAVLVRHAPTINGTDRRVRAGVAAGKHGAERQRARLWRPVGPRHADASG